MSNREMGLAEDPKEMAKRLKRVAHNFREIVARLPARRFLSSVQQKLLRRVLKIRCVKLQMSPWEQWLIYCWF